MFKSNQLLALLKVGHEVDTAAKAPSFVNLSMLPALGRPFGQTGGKIPPLREKFLTISTILRMFNLNKLPFQKL
jgi:hypothetical protein